MSFKIRRLPLCAGVLALVSGCADGSTGPTTSKQSLAPRASQNAPPVADINGVWPFHEDATFLLFDFVGQSSKVFRCSSDGAYTFVQTGATFAGSFDQVGVCTAADGTSFPNNFTGALVTGGSIQGLHVSFEADGCPYEGALRGPGMTEMGGGGRCGGGGTFGTYRAAWSASR